jgi:hypothetical protein
MANKPTKRERLENAGLIKPSDRSPETEKILRKLTHKNIDTLIDYKKRKKYTTLAEALGIITK